MLIMLYLGRRRPVVGQCPNLALDPSLCLHLPLLRVEKHPAVSGLRFV